MLKAEIEKAQILLEETEARIIERTELESERNAGRERQAALRVENDTLRVDMNQLKERIETLKSAEGASCPLCGQVLSDEHRQSTLQQLEEEGKQKGDLYRANQKKTVDLAAQVGNYESQITKLASAAMHA